MSIVLIGAKAKVMLAILLAASLSLGVWHLSRPHAMPAVGSKYVSDVRYSSLGSWTVEESLPMGRIFLAIPIGNLTFPRISLLTTYSLAISEVNETVTGFPVDSISLQVTGLLLEGNMDGSVSSWGKTNDLQDAIQITTLFFFFETSASHELRFTLSYDLYEPFPVGYWPAI